MELLDVGKNKESIKNNCYFKKGSEEMAEIQKRKHRKMFFLFLLLAGAIFFLLPKTIYAETIKGERSQLIPPVTSIYGTKVLIIKPNAPQLKMIEGSSQQLYYQVLPTTALNPKVTFATSDKKVVSVDSKGVMKGLMPGRAIITISSTDGSGVRTRVTVQVTKKVSRVKNIAHRGIVDVAPENSMAAFKAAGEKGFWGIEFDIQTTKDHRFIVMHDADIARMTNGSGYVKDYTRWEIRRYKIDSGENLKDLPTQRIPELTDVLNLCRAYNMVPVIELKEVQVSELGEFLAILKKYDLEDRAVVISFKLELLEWLRSQSETLQLQWIEKSMSTSHITLCSSRKIDIDTKLHGVTEQKVRFAHELGVAVNCWTILKDTEYQRMQDADVDYITMDMIPPALR